MYFYYYFEPLNNDHLNLHTNSYNISVKQQQFSLVSLGCLWSDVTESLIRQTALENYHGLHFANCNFIINSMNIFRHLKHEKEENKN